MKREYIKRVFTDWDKLKVKGIYLSGIEGEGEYKSWYPNGQLYKNSFYKDGKLEGEYKVWYLNGQLYIHSFYKDDKENGEYKKWLKNGQLYVHGLCKNGEVIKDYLK